MLTVIISTVVVWNKLSFKKISVYLFCIFLYVIFLIKFIFTNILNMKLIPNKQNSTVFSSVEQNESKLECDANLKYNAGTLVKH